MLRERGVFLQRLGRKFSRLHNLRQEQDKNSAKSRGVCEKFRNFALKQYKTFLHEEIYSRHPDGHHNALIVL